MNSRRSQRNKANDEKRREVYMLEMWSMTDLSCSQIKFVEQVCTMTMIDAACVQIMYTVLERLRCQHLF